MIELAGQPFIPGFPGMGHERLDGDAVGRRQRIAQLSGVKQIAVKFRHERIDW